ncbi:MAG TPA: glycosyltransferase family 4 protein [Armatimonadota bacterium]|nr:glycosyltransferase family 4 protein [Armatimonadota bacterium]
MNLLIVSQWFPCPPINGARQRAFHLLHGLAANHEVRFLSFAQNPSDMERTHELTQVCREVVVVPRTEYKPSVFNGLRALFSSRPRSSLATYSPIMAQVIREQLHAHRFDAAIALTTVAGEYLRSVKVPTILDNDNVDTAYFRRLVQMVDSPLAQFRRKLTWVKVARYEKRLVASFNATTVVSEDDRQELARLVPDKHNQGVVHVVPNGVDLRLLDYQGPVVDSRAIIFTGALTYQANLDAARYFCREILPKIRSSVPDVRVLITGSHAGVDITPLVDAGAELTGFVDDIRPLVAGSAALIVPLRIGGGTRLKILEAMALGTPVVSTSLGAAGIGVKHEETALLADDPEQFASCTVRLMQDRMLRERISSNAKSYVAANFGWNRCVEALENVLDSVVIGKREV